MKIWCDVCGKEEATVFCSADEAALCNGCDGRVHYANKLASKHLRFSLVNPQYQESPLCDICQKKRALLFCQEDRAILCRECDVPIHEANEHTQKHNRFVLTGVKLSPYSSLYPKNPSSSTNSTLTNDHFSKITNKSPASSSSNLKKSPTDQILIHHSSPHDKTLPLTYNYNYNYNYDYDNNNNKAVDDDPHNNNNIEQQQQQQLNHTSDDGSVSTSSLTEYLMETLPGWQVEDLLDPSSSPNGFCKTFDNLTPYVDDQDLENNMKSFQSEELAIWVPQVSYQNHLFPFQSDHIHAVPHACTPPAMKRRRNFW